MFEKQAESKAIETCPYNLDMPTYAQGFVNGAKFGYNKANEWHYVKDCLPPEPECDGDILKPLDYFCAYKLKDGGYETDFFTYYGNGEFLGENREYPIYAWLGHPVCVPEPPKE